jgi:AAA family ATP:ADP antiporter
MLERWLTRLFNIEHDEVAPVVAGFVLFFLLFAGYFMLRPVRETMGITGGVDNLQWLFTGTFVATLAAMPLFGWVAAHVRRRRILYWVFGFFSANLVGFALGFLARPDNVWLARAFYIWLSVFNMIAISLAWSVLVDLFAVDQAKRLFGLMAAGASLGGLTGPILGVLLVGPIGHAGLLFLSAVLLIAAAVSARRVQHWRDAHPASDAETLQRAKPLGGSPFAGATEVLRSPYMIGIAVFVVLLASVTTFLYFEQARLVQLAFPDKADQTRVFGAIDATVQAIAILSQLFITGRIAKRLGIGVLLVAVPVVVVFGFLWLALAPTFAVLAVVMVTRRAGEYAFVRPGREMLWTAVAPQAKYKAKNFVDTVVYRGADAISAWVKAGVDLLAQQPAIAAVLGAAIALLWAFNGVALARMHRRMASP